MIPPKPRVACGDRVSLCFLSVSNFVRARVTTGSSACTVHHAATEGIAYARRARRLSQRFLVFHARNSHRLRDLLLALLPRILPRFSSQRERRGGARYASVKRQCDNRVDCPRRRVGELVHDGDLPDTRTDHTTGHPRTRSPLTICGEFDLAVRRASIVALRLRRCQACASALSLHAPRGSSVREGRSIRPISLLPRCVTPAGLFNAAVQVRVVGYGAMN